MPKRITTVMQIPGDEWIADGRDGHPTQDAQWYLLRRRFYDSLPGQWRLVTEPEERIEFDEEAREVKLWIGALAEQVRIGRVPAGRGRFA